MPNAVVNRSPRSMTRSDGLSSPSVARDPAREHQVAGQWRAVPAQQPDRLLLGHARPQTEQQPPDAVRCLAGGVLERRDLLDLVDGPQAVGRVDEDVRGIDHAAGWPRRGRGSGPRDRTARRSTRGLAYAFQPMTPTRAPGDDPFLAQDLGQRPGPVAWLVGQAQVLVQVAAHRQRRRAGHAKAFVAHQDGRIAIRADHQDRLLEARVEASQVADVGAVLAVRVEHDPVEAAPGQCGQEPLHARPVRVGSETRHHGWHAQLRQVDLADPGS